MLIMVLIIELYILNCSIYITNSYLLVDYSKYVGYKMYYI